MDNQVGRKVVLTGCYNGSWCIKFQEPTLRKEEFIYCPINTKTIENFKHLREAWHWADVLGLVVVDVCHHFTIKPSWQMDDELYKELTEIRQMHNTKGS